MKYQQLIGFIILIFLMNIPASFCYRRRRMQTSDSSVSRSSSSSSSSSFSRSRNGKRKSVSISTSTRVRSRARGGSVSVTTSSKKITVNGKTVHEEYTSIKIVTSISSKVCPRPSNNQERQLANQLLQILRQKNTYTTSCSTSFDQKNSDAPNHEGLLLDELKNYKPLSNPLFDQKNSDAPNHDGLLLDELKNYKPLRDKRSTKRSRGSCDSNLSKEEHDKIVNELAVTGFPPTFLCVRREGKCSPKGDQSKETNTLNMCHSCKYTISLPPNMHPSSVNHYSCGNKEDLRCLLNEGACVKTQIVHYIAIMDNNRRFSSSGTITITTGCSCQVINGSLFQNFVVN